MPLDVLVEAVLFYKATPQKISTLKKLFAVSDEDWQQGIERLETRLESGATRIVQTDAEIQLVTAPNLSEFIEAMRKDELNGDIGKAGAETLAIVLYRGPVTRAEIDRVRGVNSAFILRNLLTRGLITRQSVKNTYAFEISPELLQHLGITKKESLPEYKNFMDAIDAFTPEVESV
jgi:segregation and condensation protein B